MQTIPVNIEFHQNSPGSYKLLADTVEGKDSLPSSELCWIPLSLLLTVLKKNQLVIKVHAIQKTIYHKQQGFKTSSDTST